MPSASKKLEANKKGWEDAAEYFFSDCALPVWAPFGVRDDKLIGQIKNKTFLEIGFGSGHSLNYLAKKGAKKIYGIDISDTQLAYAKKINEKFVQNGKVEVYVSPMEKPMPFKNIDIVYSIYALGWTVDPKKTLKNIFIYLKPGGQFIWSWDHAFFADVEDVGDKLVVNRPYHDETEIYRKWRKGSPVYITYRKTSSWFKLLREAGFEILDYLEPKPVTKKSESKTYYTINKAQNVPCSIIWVCRKPLK